MVETHDGAGAVIIVDFVVRTGFMDLPASSVYTAGPHHALFSLSMTSVARSDLSSSTDFARIEGVPVRRGSVGSRGRVQASWSAHGHTAVAAEHDHTPMPTYAGYKP